MEDTRSFIGRAEKRHAALKAQQAQLEEDLRVAENEIAETKQRLAAMEKEAAQELVTTESTSSSASGLEDAVRDLLVMLHGARGLPPAVSAAGGDVYALLPAHQMSSDVDEEPADGGMENMSESNVAAGSLDIALPDENEDVQNLTSDEDLLQWAKRQKTSRSRPY